MKTTRGIPRQKDQILEELVHDSYKGKSKLPEPSHCEQCGAVYQRGRWTWAQVPQASHATLCPACHRIRDAMPAGYVRLEGDFFRAHRDEILRRVRACEAEEKREHALQRIMAVQDEGEDTLVTTTDTHLARRIGDALQKSWKGDLEFHYNRQDNLLRVFWRR